MQIYISIFVVLLVQNLDSIAHILRRYADESRFHLPKLEEEEQDNDEEQSAKRKPMPETKWDEKARALHLQAASMGLTHVDDDDD